MNKRRPTTVLMLLLVMSAGALPQVTLAAGGTGFSMSGSLGAAGGARASAVSGSPAVAAGVELGAMIQGGSLVVGAFYDRFTSTIWQAGISARKYLGPSRLLWGQLKVSLSGMAGMLGDDAVVKEWNNYLNGGLSAGLRIPYRSKLSLQPFAGFDTFLPVNGTRRVATGPVETELQLVTGDRVFIPSLGMRVALEF